MAALVLLLNSQSYCICTSIVCRMTTRSGLAGLRTYLSFSQSLSLIMFSRNTVSIFSRSARPLLSISWEGFSRSKVLTATSLSSVVYYILLCCTFCNLIVSNVFVQIYKFFFWRKGAFDLLLLMIMFVHSYCLLVYCLFDLTCLFNELKLSILFCRCSYCCSSWKSLLLCTSLCWIRCKTAGSTSCGVPCNSCPIG